MSWSISIVHISRGLSWRSWSVSILYVSLPISILVQFYLCRPASESSSVSPSPPSARHLLAVRRRSPAPGWHAPVRPESARDALQREVRPPPCALLICSLLLCSLLFRSLLFRSLLFRSLLIRSLLFRSLLFHSLLIRSLLFRSLLLRFLSIRLLLTCSLLIRSLLIRTLLIPSLLIPSLLALHPLGPPLQFFFSRPMSETLGSSPDADAADRRARSYIG
jgi:hypothetical protein